MGVDVGVEVGVGVGVLVAVGVGVLVVYIPTEEPEGGGDWASHFPVGSQAALTYAGIFWTSVNVTVPVFESRDFTAIGGRPLKSAESHRAT